MQSGCHGHRPDEPGRQLKSMDLQPQRKLKPTRRSVSGVHVFRRQTGIPYESTLERDFLIRTEFFRSVADIVAQPIRIPFRTTNGRDAVYTPDFLVIYRLGNRAYPEYQKPKLVEVKPEREWRKHWRRWRRKWRAAMRVAKNRGWTFHVHDESRIRDSTLQNIRFLQRYKRMRFPDEESQWLLDVISRVGAAPMRHLVDTRVAADRPSVGIAHLWHLLATRRLDCDISRPLNHDTEFWIPTDE